MTVRNFTPYEAPVMAVPPQGLDSVDYEERFGPCPGDESKVFVVTATDMDDTAIEAVFVGNRLAAYRFEGEFNRYATGYGARTATVDEWDDHNIAEHVQVRQYREPWTQISFRTSVNLETGDVRPDWDPDIKIRNDVDPQFHTTREPDGPRGRYHVVITTMGPDTQIDQLRHLHAENVNKTRANVLDDITKDQP